MFRGTGLPGPGPGPGPAVGWRVKRHATRKSPETHANRRRLRRRRVEPSVSHDDRDPRSRYRPPAPESLKWPGMSESPWRTAGGPPWYGVGLGAESHRLWI